MDAAGIEWVVARYREDLEWTGRARERGYAVTVYDKGGDPGPRSVPLPNVGREAHTYLTHILTRYPAFADYTVFLQGDPFPHLAQGAGWTDLEARIGELVGRKVPFSGLAWFRMRCDGLGRPHHMDDPAKKGRWAGWGKDIPVADLYRRLFFRDPPREFLASAAAGMFLVQRARILARPRAFYAHALNQVLADPQDADNTGHAFERLWQVVFNGNPALNRDAYPGV